MSWIFVMLIHLTSATGKQTFYGEEGWGGVKMIIRLEAIEISICRDRFDIVHIRVELDQYILRDAGYPA